MRCLIPALMILGAVSAVPIEDNGNTAEAAISHMRVKRFTPPRSPYAGAEDNTPLHTAVIENRMDEVRRLIENGANVDAQNSLRNTPLHFACYTGNMDIAALLLRNKANVNAENYASKTPLSVAADEGFANVVQLLIDNGATIQPLPYYTVSDSNILKILIANGADVNGLWYGQTYLQKIIHFGSEYNHLAQFLIDNHANVNVRGVHGKTPLHTAVENGPDEMVELLIANKADVNAADDDGDTPLHEVGTSNSAISVALMLIQNHADVNAKNNDNETPLHKSIWKPWFAKILIENGANVNAKEKDGFTPLLRAVRAVFDKDVLASYPPNRDPAIRASWKEFAQILVNNGADINAANNNGKTACGLVEVEDRQIAWPVLGCNASSI